MKKIFSIIAVSSILFFGCDKVEVPQQTFTVVVPTSDTVRKIFIEDFTGHVCQNCPAAAHKLDSLRSSFPERIVAMSVHIDYFSEPCDGVSPHPPMPVGAIPGTFQEDFRTPENANYESIYHMYGNWAYPTGLINRFGTTPVDHTAWAPVVASLLDDSMTAYIKINPTYTSSTRNLNITVTGEFLCDTTGTYNIALYLVENDLHGSQVDITVPGSIDNNYVFNDVFRGCINTPGLINGETITTPASILGHTPINYTSPSFIVSNSYNEANCKIIAVLINTADGGVLQAAECDLQ